MEWIRKEEDRIVAVLQLVMCFLALLLAVSHRIKVVEKIHRRAGKKKKQ